MLSKAQMRQDTPLPVNGPQGFPRLAPAPGCRIHQPKTNFQGTEAGWRRDDLLRRAYAWLCPKRPKQAVLKSSVSPASKPARQARLAVLRLQYPRETLARAQRRELNAVSPRPEPPGSWVDPARWPLCERAQWWTSCMFGSCTGQAGQVRSRSRLGAPASERRQN